MVKKGFRGETLFYAVLAQAILLALTVFVVVMRPFDATEPSFKAQKSIYLPQRELEHAVALSEFQQSVGLPKMVERLTVDSLQSSGLPPLPELSDSEYDPFESTDFLSSDASALLSDSGLMQGLGNLSTATSTASFFGLEDNAQKVVIIVNTSASVMRKASRRGVSIQKIQDEVIEMIKGLESGTLFGIVQFSQGVRVFSEFLVPAISRNKASVSSWVRENLKGNPPVNFASIYFGHEAAFESAFQLEPDVIFLVTDGVLNRRTVSNGKTSYPVISYQKLSRSIDRLSRDVVKRPRVHVVGFEMTASDSENMQKFTRKLGGQLREF